uniref:HTH myb-type domain-containing protein n=1 Tax=Globisporangium ultimum (strain ATCC 200006 / CBS 805.95 / DAOM BR144) TaxID=431595 RepID=K3WD06_GLOUD
MTITSDVQTQFFDKSTNKLICLPNRSASSLQAISNTGAPWTDDEHARFLAGLELFPSGPWKSIASCVGTRTARQTMSHAQKYRQKIARRQRDSPTSAESNAGLGKLKSNLNCCALHSADLTDASLSDVHLTGNLLDEILMSLFEDNGGEPIEITQEDLGALMSFQ